MVNLVKFFEQKKVPRV